MNALHRLLARQMRRAGVPDGVEGPLADLLQRVSDAYDEADQHRAMMEHTLAVASREMRDLYDDLKTRSDAIHAATLESSSDGVLLLDEQRNVLSTNQRFLEIYGIPAEIAATKSFAKMLEVGLRIIEEPETLEERSRALAHHPLARGEDELRLRDGRVIQRETAPVVDASGRVLGRVWFHRDITEPRRHESELREARDAAERALHAKSEFLANMSHELRTPLNAILGFTRVLRRLNADHQEMLDDVVHAAEHMLALVNDLLDLRRAEDGRAPFVVEAVDVHHVVRRATGMVSALVEERGLQLRLEIDEVLGPRALAEPRALLQIMVNLLSNAAKFTPAGGNIAVRAVREGERVCIAVSDDGVGMTKESAAQLFTYYMTTTGRTDCGLKGSGIGLALTRALLVRMGGEISVASEPNKGATFMFTLPAAPPTTNEVTL